LANRVAFNARGRAGNVALQIRCESDVWHALPKSVNGKR
jgi:hypothetical protein